MGEKENYPAATGSLYFPQLGFQADKHLYLKHMKNYPKKHVYTLLKIWSKNKESVSNMEYYLTHSSLVKHKLGPQYKNP